jgi:Transposase IS66 family
VIPDPAVWLDHRLGIVHEAHLRVGGQCLAYPVLDLGGDGTGCHRPEAAGQFVSKDRTAQALAELFGIPLSSGTVAALTARAAGRLGGFLEHARDQIAASAVAGFDETGFRVAGRLHWVHCARTSKYAGYPAQRGSYPAGDSCGAVDTSLAV